MFVLPVLRSEIVDRIWAVVWEKEEEEEEAEEEEEEEDLWYNDLWNE